MHTKPTILFISAFKPSGSDGTVGGITYACQTLLQSPQSQAFNWILLDTTASTNNPRSFAIRTLHALKRLILFVWYLLVKRPDKVAIFIGHGGSFYEKGLMALIARKFSTPVVLAPISGFIKTDLETSERAAKFARKVFSACEVIICQSNSWRTFYQQYCSDEQKLKVVQNWLDVESYTVGSPQQKAPLTTILYLAWVVREKGIFELLDALRDVGESTSEEYRVVICGGGGELVRARQLVVEYGLHNVQFDGWVTGNAKSEYLLSSHIFILPSYAEGLSNSLLEAMASGLAVVSTDVGGAVDVIELGVNGLLIKSRSSEQIREALLRLLRSPEEQQAMGIAARQSVMENNSIETGVSKFLALLEK